MFARPFGLLLEHSAVDYAWCDTIDRYAVSGEFDSGSSCHALDRAFGCGIASSTDRAESCDRTRVDDPAVFSFLHAGRESSHHVQRALGVTRNGQVKISVDDIDQLVVADDAGEIEQRVDPPECLEEAVTKRIDGDRVRDIAGRGVCDQALGLQKLGGLCRKLSNIDSDDSRARLSESSADRDA